MSGERAHSTNKGAVAPVLSTQCAGRGQPLIMLGGGTTGAAGFAAHARALAGEFLVVRLQTLNVECSDRGQPLPAAYSIKRETEAMHHSLERLGVSRPIHLIGHSLGGLIALDFALDQPQAVRSLVLSEPPAFWVLPEVERAAEPDLWKMITTVHQFEPTIEPTDDHLVAFLHGLGEPRTDPPHAADPARAAWDVRRRRLRGLSAVATHTDAVARLEQLRIPVLLVEGANTALFHRRLNALLARHLPQVERIVLSGGHGAILSAPSEFLPALRAFLRRVPGG